jgi:hypothetical protein
MTWVLCLIALVFTFAMFGPVFGLLATGIMVFQIAQES